MNNTIVVGMGEALWDMLPEGKKIGGAPANFAYHVSQFGLDSRVVSAVGEDELGAEILKNFREKKLNCMSLTRPGRYRWNWTSTACPVTTSARAWRGTTFPSHPPWKDWHARPAPYVSARWHSAAWFRARPLTASSMRCPTAKDNTKYSI